MPRALPREWCGNEIRNAGVLRERAPARRGTILAWTAAALLLLGSLLLYVTQGLQVIRLGYEIDRLQDRYRAARAEQGRLEVELASLQDLATVQREAIERHGMVFPVAGQVVVVRGGAAADAVARVRGPVGALAAAARE
jgi:cell division protein FtsL